MLRILGLLALTAVINAQYYYGAYEPEQYEPSYYGGINPYYNQWPYYYAPRYQQPSYGRAFRPYRIPPSYGRELESSYDVGPSYDIGVPLYGGHHQQQGLYAFYDPYEYEPEWVSPYVVRRPRPSYFWSSPAYERMARKKNKGGGGGNKKGGGGGHHEEEGGWWYIRDKHGHCKSGTWGKPPPHGLEREHYSQGACGYLGGHSQRVHLNHKPGWTSPLYLPRGGPHGGSGKQGGGGGGGGQGGGGGGGYAKNYGWGPSSYKG